MNDIPYDEWFKKLQKIADKLDGISIPDDQLEDWKDYYNDEYSPKDAWNEDLSHG